MNKKFVQSIDGIGQKKENRQAQTAINKKTFKKSIFFNYNKLAIILLLILFLVTGFIWSQTKEKGMVLGEIEEVLINVPDYYSDETIFSKGNNFLTVKPNSGNRVMVDRVDNQYIYRGAYKYTDVIQTDYKYKIKEEMYFSQPGHPIKFSYMLGNIENYVVQEDNEGNIVFYDRKLYEQIGEFNSLSRIFTISTPFVEDKIGKRSFAAVTTEIENDILTISINRDWLIEAAYPVILDPTIEINILNVYSHPQQGDDWTVSFITSGEADLYITPNDEATIADDEFVSLSCDGIIYYPQILPNDIIYYPNWSCSGVGEVVHYTRKAGKHTLRFNFGEAVGWAYNDPGDAWWDTNWDYRKEITMTGSSGGAQTDYQMKIVVNYGNGSDSGLNVYCGSNCQTDFDDIRFTASDGTTELDYYLDQKTNSDKALFWVKVPSIPASPDTVDIYVYYGNSGATTTSNGTNTFVLFEDFEDTTYLFDVSGATTINLGTSTSPTPKQGTYVGLNSGSQGYKKRSASSLSWSGSSYRVESWANVISGGGTNENLGSAVTIFGASGNNNGYEVLLDDRSSVSPQIRRAWDYNSRTNGNFQTSKDTWYFITAHEDNGKIIGQLFTEAQAYTSSPQTTTSRTDSTYTSGYPGIGTYSANHTAWDAWRVRKYVLPEPSISSYGSEETLPTNSAPTITQVIDEPDPATAGETINFTVNWQDADVEDTRSFICKTNSFTTSTLTCPGGWWASTTAFTSTNPVQLSYNTTETDIGVNNYYAFVCDDEVSCSTAWTGSFIIQKVIGSSGYDSASAYIRSDFKVEEEVIFR